MKLTKSEILFLIDSLGPGRRQAAEAMQLIKRSCVLNNMSFEKYRKYFKNKLKMVENLQNKLQKELKKKYK